MILYSRFVLQIHLHPIQHDSQILRTFQFSDNIVVARQRSSAAQATARISLRMQLQLLYQLSLA